MFPICSIDESKKLINKWCKIFFWWVSFFWNFNWRATKNANFKNLFELKKTIERINLANWEFNLTLNAFESENYNDFKNIYSILNFLKWTKFNLIIKDFKLIDFINTKFPNIDIHISTINWVTSSFWIKFFQNNFKNIKRICFEKTLNFSELKKCLEKSQSYFWNWLELEMITSPVCCKFIEWNCILHWLKVCYSSWTTNPFFEYNQSCSYCWIFELFKYNFLNIKIVFKISWRERAFEDRLRNYELTKNFLSLLIDNKFNNQIDVFEYKNKNDVCKKWECCYL